MPNLKACKRCYLPTSPNPTSDTYKKRSTKNADYCEDCYKQIKRGMI